MEEREKERRNNKPSFLSFLGGGIFPRPLPFLHFSLLLKQQVEKKKKKKKKSLALKNGVEEKHSRERMKNKKNGAEKIRKIRALSLENLWIHTCRILIVYKLCFVWDLYKTSFFLGLKKEGKN